LAGSPVTFGVGHGFDGVGSGVSDGVEAVGTGALDDGALAEGELEADGELPAAGLSSEQADNKNTASADNPKTASPKLIRSRDNLIVSNPPGAGRDSR
jgi:hypothetical protein